MNDNFNKFKLLYCLFVFLSLQAGTFVSFDNARSIGCKVEYAMQNNLKGVMIWQVASDKTGDLYRAVQSNLKPGKECVVYFPEYVTGLRGYQVADVEKLLQQGIKITSLVYCFLKPQTNGTLTLDDPEVTSDIHAKRKATLEELKALKKRHPEIKLFLSLGGWGAQEPFFAIAKNKQLRRLAFNCIKVLGDDFDGIDIDWEFGSSKEFKLLTKYYPTFITYLMQAVEAQQKKTGKRALVTIAMMPNLRFCQEFTGLAEVAKKVDWINLMSYNYEDPSFSEITAHNAPLYSHDTPHKRRWKKTKPKFESVDSSVQAFLRAGVPADKLVLGLAFYGHSYEGVKPGPESDGLYQTFKGPLKHYFLGPYKAGNCDYDYLVGNVPLDATMKKQRGFTCYWDEVCKVPYLYSP